MVKLINADNFNFLQDNSNGELILIIITENISMSSKKNQKQNQPTEQQKRQAQLLEMKKNDPSHLKQDIFRLKEQLSDIVTKKKILENQIQQHKIENLTKTQIIQKSLKEEEEYLIDIENRYNQLVTKNEAEIKALVSRYDQEERAILNRNQKEVQRSNAQYEKIREKVQYLNKYKERRQKYLQSIEQLNKRLEQMHNKQEKDINNIHNSHFDKRQRLQKQTVMEMEKIKQHQVNRLEQKMSREQFIKKQNDVMENEILLCEQQIKVLSKQCQDMKNQMANEKLLMNDNTLGNQASQTYQRSLRIIKLQGKMAKLKTYLAEQSAKLEKEYLELDTLYTKQHQEIESKVTKIDGWIRIKERDLKKVKACSQMVLNQRSNLQSYLLQVFYEHPDIDYKDSRSINKILRFLFAKINSKKPPMTYKNYLPESLKSISQSSFRA